MSVLEIKEIFAKEIVDTEATVKGWVRSIRKSKKFSFVTINDGTCQASLQVIVDADLENYDEVSTMGMGSAVAITGPLVVSGGKGQKVEMQGKAVTILGGVTEDYPLQKKATSLEFLREVAHLRPRTNTFSAVFRVRHHLSMATHKFFDDRGFYYLHSPIITGVDAEGAGEMFRVTTMDLEKLPKNDKGEVDYNEDYFGKDSSLAVTGQLEGECFATAMKKVYTFGPTFRSENSNTTRHLAEFWMIEPEVAFADLDDVAQLGSEYIQYLISYALEHCKDELDFLAKNYVDNPEEHFAMLTNVRDSKFIKITYTEAIEILEASGQKFEHLPKWGVELQTEHERFLSEKHFKGPVIVTDYPKDCKAFYMRQNDDGKTVRAMDVLVPGVGEIIGGSQREERLDLLEKRIDELEMNREALWWYIDLRKFGSVEHSGFGLGFERAIMYITGMKNIRDVIPFPRTPKNCEF